MDLPSYVKQRMCPLHPIPTEVTPRLEKRSEIKMVAFDIYGTLLVSSAGDITAAAGEADKRKAMRLVLDHLGCSASNDRAASLVIGFGALQAEAHESIRERGVIHSELDIRLIWKQLFANFLNLEISDAQVDEVALIYECEVNPVWEMPGAKNVLAELQDRDFTLGIVSNAQDYTKSIFEAMLGKSISAFGMDASLSIFSYEVGEGKPSPQLYQDLAAAARTFEIRAEEILYVGNDVRKDIEPARMLGFQTALFAGDQRSLRFGERGVEEALSLADCVLTDLRQLVTIV